MPKAGTKTMMNSSRSRYRCRCRSAEDGWLDRRHATDNATPKIPFWLMVFRNIRVFLLGSDDFPTEAKVQAARDLTAALEAGWPGFETGERIPPPRSRRPMI
jgi:hypothetical protein